MLSSGVGVQLQPGGDAPAGEDQLWVPRPAVSKWFRVRCTVAASYQWDVVWVQRQRESGRWIHQGPGHQEGGAGAPPL